MHAVSEKLKPLLPLATLPLILLICASLWFALANESYVSVESDGGYWDLRDFDFSDSNARLSGEAVFIPSALLTPDEFAALEGEAALGFPGESAALATTRIRMLMPDDGYYTFSRISTDFAERIFVNGVWLRDIGAPSEHIDSGTPFTERITFTSQAVDGTIEIVQQTSNFDQRGGNIHPQDWRVGSFGYYNTVLRSDYTVNIILGAYLSLFIIFMLLFFMLRGYKTSLYFALFCLMWFLRSGVTGSRVFAALMPWLSGAASMRIEYVAMPVAAVLTVAIIENIFMGLKILHPYFVRAVMMLSAAFAIIFLAMPTTFIIYFILASQVVYLLCIIYIFFRIAPKLHRCDMAQGILFIGVSIFMYSAVRDFSYYSFSHIITLPPFGEANFTQVAVLAFALCEAVAVFIATMREAEGAKDRERMARENERVAQESEKRLAESNAALERLSRMKTEYLANMSHDIKTPLSVVLSNIQVVAMLLKEDHGINDEDINRSIQTADDEIKRMARLTESALQMASLQESRDKMEPHDPVALFTTGAEAYRGVIERQGIELEVIAESDLPQISGNADQLIQVLSNLLENSSKHMNGGVIELRIGNGELKIEDADAGTGADVDASRGADVATAMGMEHEGDGKEIGDGNSNFQFSTFNFQFIKVCVKDNGSGIAPELLPLIFRRGVTGSGGTGMGLAICKGIIETHGGTIKVESEPGKGTAVTFTIPAFNKGGSV